MAKFATNVSGAILLPSSIQVMESISGSVLPLAMIAGQFGATFTSKYFPVVMYWNYIWLQNIIPTIHGTQVRSGGFKCGGGVVME